MKPVQINIEKLVKNLSIIGSLLVIVFGISFASVIQRAKSIVEAPGNIDSMIVKLDRNINIIKQFEDKLEALGDYQEMSWELMRLMTDDDDTINWYYADEKGKVFNVDIRSTAEDVELAFIFKEYMIYPIYHSHADNRLYIIVHDHTSDKNENYYLFEK